MGACVFGLRIWWEVLTLGDDVDSVEIDRLIESLWVRLEAQ